MKRLTNKQQAARIDRIMDRWLRRLDLYNTWDICVELVCGSHFPSQPDDTTVLASIEFNEPYRRATISLNCGLAAIMSDADLEHNLLHELVHVLVRPVVAAAVDHIPKVATEHFRQAHESVTDTITHLLLWDRKGERNR
ncbi:hypothetical protein LCGC14_0722830 [marine sediment metagenome]|uniref:SprT-like domain-containing protein n=1 Tax=marine sediment metagenome TaxID=412755 RepID=A0A0F9QG11_9ZZZZ